MNNMKLCTTITSERGKPLQKTANDYIRMDITYSEKRKKLAVVELKRTSANVDFYNLYCNGELIMQGIDVPK